MEPIDQYLRPIRETGDVVDYTPLPKFVKYKSIPFHTTPLHGHPNTVSNQNSRETMFSKDSETLWGSSTMVMSGSHFSNVHLRSNILQRDYAALSSSTHNDISLIHGEDIGGKG